MANVRFRRRLWEALATATGGGVGAPPAADEGGDDEREWEPDPRQVKAIYDWVRSAPAGILGPILGVLELATPALHTGTVHVTDPAGLGYPSFGGYAVLTASWRVDGGDPQFGPMERALRAGLLRSDLWKALGVEYNLASRVLGSRAFLSHVSRALAFKLKDTHHAAYWLHLMRGKATDLAIGQIWQYLQKAPDQAIAGYDRLRRRGHQLGVVPGSLRVSPDRKPVSIADASVPLSRLVGGSGDPGLAGEAAFRVAASLRFVFTGTVDFYRRGPGPFERLPVATQSDIVSGLRSVMEVAWEGAREGFEVELNPTGGDIGSYWEPAEGPQFDPTWYPREITYRVRNWLEIFRRDDVEVEPGVLAEVLPSLPPTILHLLRIRVDATGITRDAYEHGVETVAVLSLESAGLSRDGLDLRLALADVTVD